MKIGIGLPAAVPGVETALITRWARSAEARGFDALGVIDRVVYDNHEPLMTLAAAAVVTERVELLTDVLIAPIRTTALLAKQAATLDRLSGGRLTLGLGLGGRVEDFTAAGMLTDGRGRRFDQQLRDLRELWSGGRIGPAPARPGGPPLMAAGYAPRAVDRAARLADGWCAGVGRIEQFAESAALLHDAWSRYGRAGRPRTLAFAYYALGPGGREATERELRHYYAWLGHEAVDGIAASALTEPTAIIDWLAAHADAGADEALLMPCSADLMQVELLAHALAERHAIQPAAAQAPEISAPRPRRGGAMNDATESTMTGRGMAIAVRAIEPADGDECARILYEAFGRLHDHHRFPRDFPTLEAAGQLTTNFIAHPAIWGVVAEAEGRIVGSNYLDERGLITGVGPITVDPEAQGHGVGRRLMKAVMERGAGAQGMRLFQDSFNLQSLSLYASLGFEVKEPAVVISGTPRSGPAAGIAVRPLEEADLEQCESLCLTVHGFERTNELRDALQIPVFSPSVALREGRITAYATTLTFFPAAYAVAETEDDMSALIAGALAASDVPASFLVPTRQAGLLRWCLSEGLRAVKPMTYMSIGEYRQPDGCWIPSVLY